MNTEIILYKQQLAVNNGFNITPDYGWTYTGNWDKEKGKLVKNTGDVGTLYQTDLLVPGVMYRVRFNVSSRTIGSASFKCDASGTNHVPIGSNAIFDTTFTADGTDILFETTSNFDGAISKFSITEYPDAYNLDLYNDVSVPLNFNIDDIFEIGKRKTTFSKTFQIPGTKNNNIAFDHVYKINSEDLFVPTKLSHVRILNSGIQIFDGSLSIDTITKNIRDGIEQIEYNVTVFGNLVDIFDKLGNSTIKDLDFARWDHTFDIETILRSSGTSWTVGGLQEIQDNSTSPATFIDNQVVAYTKNGNSIGSYSYGGYARVEINFSTAHSFVVGDNLTLISDNDKLSGEQTVVYVYSNNIVLNMLWSNLDSGTFSNLVVERRTWNSQGYYYPMCDSGSWMRECINGDIAPSNTNTAGQLTQGKLYTVKYLVPDDDFSNIAKDPVTGSAMTVTEGCTFLAVQTGSYFPNTPTTPTIWANGTILLTHDLEVNGAKIYYKKLFANHWYPTDFIPHIYVKEVWDKMFQLIDYYYDCDIITNNNLFSRLIMPVDQSFNIYEFIGQDASPYVGPLDAQYVYMNDWLPKMPLKDFFISILNLFNLVVLENKDQPNLVELVSRSDFYNTTNIELEADTSQNVEIKLANSFLPKSYQVKYKDSEDFFNKDYNTDFGNIANTNGITNAIDRKYGDLYNATGNVKSTDVKVTELSFVPTVLAGNITGVYDTFNVTYGQDKVFSTCFDADTFGNNAKRNISNRILIAGLRGTNYPWSLQASVADAPNSMADVYDQYYGYATRWFPYAGHIENVFDAVPRDINFGTLLGQYFPQTYTANDWYYKTNGAIYWGKYLLDITNVNGRIISGTFKFSITDIYNLDFRNVYRLNNYSLKLGKVTDWDVNGDGFAKCEFILKNI